jgi:hypothetical protein
MDLNDWFHWPFPSPGYFLLALVGLFVLLGLIGGLTHSRSRDEADNLLPDREPHSGKPWWERDEEHYREWYAYQVREEHRSAGKHSLLD